MGDFIGQVVLLTIHAERKRNSYFRFETGKDKIQYQIGTTRHRNTRSSQLVPIIILENHICDNELSHFMRKLFMPYANDKGADQPMHPLAVAAISRLQLASLAEQTSLSCTWSQIPKTGFLVTMLRAQQNLHSNMWRSSEEPGSVCTTLKKFYI